MKTRLAKKLARTPIDKLSKYWIDKLFVSGGGKKDKRIDKALKIVSRKI